MSKSREHIMPRAVFACAGAILSGALAAAGCSDPEPAALVTLDAPTDVEAMSFCLVPSAEGWQAAFADDEACVHYTDIPVGETDTNWNPFFYVAAIANAGEGAIQTYALDTRSSRWLSALRSPLGVRCLEEEVAARQPIQTSGGWVAESGGDSPCSATPGTGVRSIDNAPSVPGNQGIAVQGRPEALVAAHVPGVAWAITTSPDQLVAVDLVSGQPVATDDGLQGFELPFPPAEVIAVRDTGQVAVANPRDNEVVIWDATFTCGGDTDVNATDCELSVSLEEYGRIALDGAPLYMDASREGDLYISADTVPVVTRVSLQDGECPINSPCEIPLTWGCSDGLDNDGNGLIDEQDPTCYRANMHEGPTGAACSDGIDNDQDGLVDARDFGCGGPGDRSEDFAIDSCDDGFDNDLDGLTDGDDPDCINGGEEFALGSFVRPFFPPFPRYTPEPVYPGPITVSADGDIVLVAEYGGNRVDTGAPGNEVLLLCGRPLDEPPTGALCDEANTLIELHQDDPTRERTLGLTISSTVTDLLTALRIERLPIENPDNIVPNDESRDPNAAGLVSRRAFVPAADGRVYVIDIDRFWSFVDPDGEQVSDYEPLARLSDADGSQAEVRNLRQVLAERVPGVPADYVSVEPGEFTLFPSLYALDPTLVGGSEGDDIRIETDTFSVPEAFFELVTESRYCFDFNELGCLTEPSRDRSFLPYDFSREREEIPADNLIPEENWTLAWEGSLPIGIDRGQLSTSRSDAVVLEDGWIEFLGDEPCALVDNDSDALCALEFGWSACPELQDFCEDGSNICGANFDVCDICPEACRGEVDLCAAGVLPGDIVIVPPLATAAFCPRGDDSCNADSIPTQCLGDSDSEEPSLYGDRIPGTVTRGNEYRVAEVRGNAIRVEPLAFTDRERYLLPSSAPDTTCFRKPFNLEIVAADSWVLSGSRFVGVDSPYESQDGFCAPRAIENIERLNPRPEADTLYSSRFGLSFRISPGDYLRYCEETDSPAECRHAMRGFRLLFATNDGFTPRNRGAVGSLATGSSYAANRNIGEGQLLFIDGGLNRLSVLENDVLLGGNIFP